VRTARFLILFLLCSAAALLATACVERTLVTPTLNSPTPRSQPATPAASAAPAATPTVAPTTAQAISVNPFAGGPRTQVTIAVSGFPARTPVTLRFVVPNAQDKAQSIGEVVTDDEGKVSIAFVMPDRWSNGAVITEPELLFVVADPGSRITATARFDFEPGVPARPSPTLTPHGDLLAYISFKWLNVRSGPGNGYDLVTRIEQGETISLLGRNADGAWVEVRLPGGQLGWVPAAYIEANAPITSLPVVPGAGAELTPSGPGDQAEAYVIRRWANMHSGPGVNFSLIMSLERDLGMDLLGRNPDATWVQVRLADGQQGWVNALSIEASVPISDLPVTSSPVVTPTPGELPGAPTAYAAAGPLEVRSGPGADYRLIVVSAISRDQGLSLLGRNAEGSWVEVRLPDGLLGWVMTRSIRANLPINNLPIIAGAKPRILVSNLAVRSGTPVQATVQGFLSNQEIVVALRAPGGGRGLTAARGKTDSLGTAQLAFTMPSLWADGSPIAQGSLALEVRSLDGSIAESVELQYLR
jgi:uncharacterized protein YgiM (DUF1202 family)